MVSTTTYYNDGFYDDGFYDDGFMMAGKLPVVMPLVGRNVRE
jgi:hypothetical protein